MDHPWMYTMDKHGETPTTRARKSGYTVLAEMLLSQERKPEAAHDTVEAAAPDGDAYWGMSHSVYKMMDPKEIVAPAHTVVDSPLHEATRNGDVEAARQLISDGAYINEENNQGLTPLHLIALNGRTDLAELFLESGAAVNQRESYTGKLTPMAMALLMGYDDLVEELSVHGGVC